MVNNFVGSSNWKRSVILIIFASIFFGCSSPNKPEPLPAASSYNFFIMSDMGDTREVKNDSTAAAMNRLAPIVQPRFIISSGDYFHNNGVQSADDSLWNVMNSKVFASPYMDVDVYPVNGNHEYIGNPQATVDYAAKNPHWKMEALNYSFVKKVDSLTSVRFIMIDTSPFLEQYKKDPKYFRVKDHDWRRTVAWLDSTLRTSTENWKIVVGHHPIFTSDFSQGNTYELIKYVDPLLRKYKVDIYFSGHIHRFEYVSRDGMDYLTTANGGSKSRITNPWFYTKYVKRSHGFSICSVSAEKFSVFFVNEHGKVLYAYRKSKAAK